MKHVIWDWNGTLFDDAHLMAASTSASVQKLGGNPVDLAKYRANHTRPLEILYESLLERTITPDEWVVLSDAYYETYLANLHTVALADGSLEALELMSKRGISQSLLSMWIHDDLQKCIETHRVDHYFTVVQGQTVLKTVPKTESLVLHIEKIMSAVNLRCDSTNTVLIGDTTDDGFAAQSLGLTCVLISTGAESRESLSATGLPVADSLIEAVSLAGLN